MSAAVIGFRTDVRIPQPGLMQLHHPAPWTDAHVPAAPAIAKSDETNAPALCYESACEANLVAAAKRGDQHAFVELLHRYSPMLKRRIRRIVRNLEDTEDVLQDTIMSALRHLAGFRGNCSFRTWMTTIAINNSLMLLRKRRHHPESGFEFAPGEGREVEILQVSDPLPNPERAYAKQQASQMIAQAVRTLPRDFRQLVQSYHQDEIRLADAASAIGISQAAAKSRLIRARKVLRRSLSNDIIRSFS